MADKPESKAKGKSVQGSVFNSRLTGRLLKYTRPYAGFFILAVGLTIISSILAPVRPWMFQQVIDGPVKSLDRKGVLDWSLWIVALLVLQTLISFLSSYLTSWLGQSVIRDIRRQVFRHLTSMRLRYFDRNPIGTLQTRTISDVETLNDVFSQGIVNILGDLLQVVVIVAFMMMASWRLTLVVLTTLPLLLFSTWIFGKSVRKSFQEVRKYVSQMNAFLQEQITGMLVTQLFNREKEEETKFRRINQDHTKANLHSVMYYSIFFPAVELISAMGIALLVWYGPLMLVNEKVEFGVLVSFIIYINMFFRPVRMLADQFNTLQMGMVSAERIFNVLDQHDHTVDHGKLGPVKMSEGDAPAIEFSHVNFSYNPGEPVLKDASFTVRPGEKVALVGFTGSGKTTIISLLNRFYDMDSGDIFIKGKDIREYRLDALRSMTGLVLQDVFLFSGTILENITLGNPDITEERAKAAAKLVGAEPFILRLPDGYAHQVRERGVSLSAGQRQLISFARVMAYDPEILILDEATSSVDTESEILIQEAIETVMKGRTSIIIAHRLSTIRKADKIMVMSHGQLVQQGSHDQLVQQEGLYRKLYQLQFAEA